MEYFLILISGILPIHNYLNNGIVFKFKDQDLKLENNSLIFKSLFSNNLISQIEIGYPKQKINIYLSSKDYEFYIEENLTNESYYNYNNSTFSKKKSNEMEFFDSPYYSGFYMQDIFTFKNTNNSEIAINNFSFILSNNLIGKGYSTIGLNYYNPSDDYNINFLKQLKEKKVISNYTWNLKYLDNNNGIITFGSFPHMYNNLFLKENLRFTSTSFNENNLDWNIFFDKIIFNNNKEQIIFKGSTICELNLERDLIKAPFEYKFIFIKYIFNQSKCEEVNVSTNIFYICDKKTKIYKLPSIQFKSRDLNFTFEMTYKDLFKEINGKLFFLIYFNKLDKNQFKFWILGKPFIKKYQFIFEQEKRLVGFYQIIENPISYFKLQVTLICILSSIIIILWILVFRFFKYKIRKKRINEIDDIYDYSSYKKECIIFV